ncbi:phage protease [Otariodibacter oris]|uniref:Phage I-like protein n=1 Tax=Otariodibacter oris TaxID=1032623 RepID=A0A420XIN7_9PAST|nr:phage protease [Otariodibacter oris]QGM80667.1 hypothetical protein A6A10_04245 [Otariodibacter oris]RKR77172.1 phage I-like protein [Otariodibacter oris]
MKFKLNPIACSFKLSQEANGRIQLFPFGWFRPQDGRQGEWYVDDSNGYQLATDINNLQIDLMIDYEHQTLYVNENGKGNPAAGWITRAEYVSGEGLFADVKWTDKAVNEIKTDVYRYISPLFLAEADGRVVKVLNAALTNRPALHNLKEAMALSSQFSQYLEPVDKGNEMKEKIKAMAIALLGLSAQASDEEVVAELTALSATKGDSPVALKEVYGKLKEVEAQKVALSAQVGSPDPAEFVALSDLQAVQTELNTLRQQVNDKERNELIQTALSDGRLLPAQKKWAEDLGKKDLIALSDYLKTVSPNSVAQGMQSGGEAPNKKQTIALSDGQIAAAKAMGITPEEYLSKYVEG